MARRTLKGLQPRRYEHPLDRVTLDVLEKVPGIDALMSAWYKFGVERLLRVHFTGSYLRATEDGCPGLMQMLRECCEVLDLPNPPALYIRPGLLNASTTGVHNPVVVLESGLIEQFTAEQLRFVIGHELGHIKSGHVLYREIADWLPELLPLIAAATLNIGNFVSYGLQLALSRWYQMSEFTADRAGLLACQNMDAAIGAMIRLAGLPPSLAQRFNTEDFIAQARAFEELDQNKLDWLFKLASSLDRSHPWTVMRASEFLKWHDTGGLEDVLKNPAAPVLSGGSAGSFCTGCGKGLQAGVNFCRFCGRPVTKSLNKP